MTLMKPPESKPPFYGSFSTFWVVFYSWAWVRDDLSYLCCEIKSHTTTTQI